MLGFLLFNPRPTSIAMIGLGGGSIAKYCYERLPHSNIVVAEISAEVVALRDQFQIPPDGQRLQVLCVDGADFVRDSGRQFDVVLVDGFDRRGQSPQLCSSAFYVDCRKRLAPGGLMVVNMAQPDVQRLQRIKRIREQFRTVVVVETDDDCSQIVFAFPAGTACASAHQLMDCLEPLERVHPVDLRRTLFEFRRAQRRQLLE
jgi:spermidine synthase